MEKSHQINYLKVAFFRMSQKLIEKKYLMNFPPFSPPSKVKEKTQKYHERKEITKSHKYRYFPFKILHIFDEKKKICVSSSNFEFLNIFQIEKEEK